MKEFSYRAVDQKGVVQRGIMLAEDEQQVLNYLHQSQMVPLQVGLSQKDIFRTILASVTGKITIDDKIYIYKSLTMLLKSGADLYQAIDVIASDIPKPAIRNFLYALRYNLEQGHPMWQVFEAYRNQFSDIEINIVRGGEEGGKLVSNLERLASDLERERVFSGKFVSAIIYPVVLLIATTGILTGVVVFLIPQVAGLFKEINVKIPIFTQIVLTVGMFLSQNIGIFLLGGFVLVVGGYLFLFKTQPGKRFMGFALLHAPVVRRVVQYKSLRDFCLGSAFLIDAGIPLMRTLTIVNGVVGFPAYRKAIAEIIESSLPRGISLAESLKEKEVFPKNLVHLVAISEKTGMLAENLKSLSDFYGFELEQLLTRLSALVEPAILIFTGLVIGSVLISIMVPIFQLVTSF